MQRGRLQFSAGITSRGGKDRESRATPSDFTGVWTSMQIHLLQQPPCSATEWQAALPASLTIGSQVKTPEPTGRSYPRKAHTRRSKSTKFMKEQNIGKKPET